MNNRLKLYIKYSFARYYEALNSTSMYLLTEYSSKQIHRNRIQCIALSVIDAYDKQKHHHFAAFRPQRTLVVQIYKSSFPRKKIPKMFLETQISFLESRKTVEIRDFFPFLLPPLHPSSTSGRKVCFVPSEAETIFHLRGDLENGFLSLHVFKVFSLSLALSLSQLPPLYFLLSLPLPSPPL